jgi:hypothetical protein
MRDPTHAGPPPPEPQDGEPRRTFVKLVLLGIGSGLAFSKLGGAPPDEASAASRAGKIAKDVVSAGVLVTRQRGGTVSSATGRSIYSFDVSATYDLSGQQISFKGISLTGKPMAGRGSGQITVSKASDLRGTLNASGCFQINGAVKVKEAASGFYSAKISLDGCVVSKAVHMLRGVILRSGGGSGYGKEKGKGEQRVASEVISFS